MPQYDLYYSATSLTCSPDIGPAAFGVFAARTAGAPSLRCHRVASHPCSAHGPATKSCSGDRRRAAPVPLEWLTIVMPKHQVITLVIARGVQNRKFCPQLPRTDSQRPGKQVTIYACGPAKLRTHLGADFPSKKIRERLKCQICSSRKVTITFLGTHQRGGNLRHLFEKPIK
jgi:hypothetical protein